MSRVVTIDYTNYRGERRPREVIPMHMRYGSSNWHPEDQWLLVALNTEDGIIKEFAMGGIHAWEQKDDSRGTVGGQRDTGPSTESNS